MLRRCITCLYPVTKPDLYFNEQGECSACVNHRRKDEIDWSVRAEEFHRIIDGLPKNDSGYDVIVASSGGKDSHAQVVKVRQLGLRPLVVTATTCHLTEIGRQNIDNLKRMATTIEISPNARVRAALNRISMGCCGDISWPEHASIFTVPFRMAAALGIPVIIYGESPQFEYGGPPGAEEARQMTSRWVSEYGGFLGWRARDFVGISNSGDDITSADMKDYELPPEDKLNGITALFLGQYFRWDSRENARIAAAHGMRIERPHEHAWWEFENLDNAQTIVHDHQMFRKFGYGRVTAQISVDIRNGRVSRDEALEHVMLHDGMLPWHSNGIDLYQMRSRIGLGSEEFVAALDQFTNWDLLKYDADNDMLTLRKAA
jgi:N-acetyl sugar amidotransferase